MENIASVVFKEKNQKESFAAANNVPENMKERHFRNLGLV